jgi:hypothetical protein
MKIEKDDSGYSFFFVGCQISQKYEKLKLKREYIVTIFPFSEETMLKFPKEIEIFSPRLEFKWGLLFFWGIFLTWKFFFQKMKQNKQTHTRKNL